MNCQDTRNRLSAYLDGELSHQAHGEVRGHLETCVECSRVLEGLTRVSSAIRTHGQKFPAPASLVQRLDPPVAARRWPGWGFAGGFAAGLTAAFVLYWAFTVTRTTGLTADLVAAHVRAIGANRLIAVASSDRHTVKPWFLGKINFAPTVPDLASSGFPLIGGRVDQIEGSSAAALVYRKQKHLITVFVMPERGGANLEWRGFSVRHWSRGDLGYWAVSDVEPADLDRFSSAFQAAF